MLRGKPNRGAGVVRWTSLLRKQFYAWLRVGSGHELNAGDTMVRSLGARAVANLGIACALTVLLGGCGSMSLTSNSPTAAPEPGVAPAMPATIRADEIVGRWGLASFQDPKDRARTEAAAKGQCKQPYVIGAGTHGGVVMHLADQATPQELDLKGSPSGKNYIGPDRTGRRRTGPRDRFL